MSSGIQPRIEKFVTSMYKKYGKIEYSRSELKHASSNGITIPGDMWKCKSSEERGSGFSIAILAEMHNVAIDFSVVPEVPCEIAEIKKPCIGSVQNEIPIFHQSEKE